MSAFPAGHPSSVPDELSARLRWEASKALRLVHGDRRATALAEAHADTWRMADNGLIDASLTDVDADPADERATRTSA